MYPQQRASAHQYNVVSLRTKSSTRFARPKCYPSITDAPLLFPSVFQLFESDSKCFLLDTSTPDARQTALRILPAASFSLFFFPADLKNMEVGVSFPELVDFLSSAERFTRATAVIMLKPVVS